METEMTKKTDQAPELMTALRLLKPSQVTKLTTVSKPQLRLLAKRGEFPQPMQISTKRIAFLESEVLDWIRQHRARPALRTWQAEDGAEASATA
jgi:predicted DNA-binding transcriptional regulator AlpA